MDKELYDALTASGLAYDMLNEYDCSPEEADEIINMIF